jgi:ATPase family associated with various cellular activities (AAA)/Winged helix domain, variant
MKIDTAVSRAQWQGEEIDRALSSVRRWLQAPDAMPLEWPPSLELLAAVFELSRFEAELLLVCAAVEFDPAVASALAKAQGEGCMHPTFGHALARLSDPHWEALTPHAPLRRWELLAVERGQTLLTSPLRIDERILHFLIGVDAFDPRLLPYVTPLVPGTPLVASHRAIAEEIEGVWRESAATVQLAGPDSGAKRAIATAVAETLGCRASVWSADNLPDAGELDRLLRLWQREAALSRAILVLDAERIDAPRDQAAVERLAERLHAPLFLLVRERWTARLRPALTFDVERPAREEQYQLWRGAIGEATPAIEDELRRVTAHFDFSAESIRATAPRWRTSEPRTLWACCRESARAAMEGLAQRLTPVAGWDDLVLGEEWKRTLRMIASQVRHRTRVYEDWQLAQRGPSGLGITALFAGPSGTGKTLAAEVIARDLDLDLCRVDLSQMVSKYIGETEKNIARICEAAEQSGAVLLFDEADALFGKRSEVKDSHDRHANIEVSYLLQRMEVYRGLAILTTNLAENIDQAFLRRLRFLVRFPLPEAAEREAIWRRVFPAAVPLERLDFPRLAQLQIPGGNIRNVAVSAMFLAAELGTPVTMPLMLEAARAEYTKIERSLRESEIEGWR